MTWLARGLLCIISVRERASPPPPTLPPPRAPSYGFWATLASMTCVVAMLPFLYMEVCTIMAYSGGWAASPWNM